MNCEDFRRELESAVEIRINPDFSEALEHLKHCPHCRELSEEYHIIERAVEEWCEVDDAPDLSGRVLAALAEERRPSQPVPPHRAPSRLISVLIGLSIVALLLLKLFSTGQTPEDNLEDFQPVITDGNTIRENTVPAPVPDEAVASNNDFERVWLDTQAAYSSLVVEVTQPFKTVVSPSMTEPDVSPDVTPEPDEQTVPQQIEGLRSELSQSFSFLKAVVPSRSPAP